MNVHMAVLICGRQVKKANSEEADDFFTHTLLFRACFVPH